MANPANDPQARTLWIGDLSAFVDENFLTQVLMVSLLAHYKWQHLNLGRCGVGLASISWTAQSKALGRRQRLAPSAKGRTIIDAFRVSVRAADGCGDERQGD